MLKIHPRSHAVVEVALVAQVVVTDNRMSRVAAALRAKMTPSKVGLEVKIIQLAFFALFPDTTGNSSCSSFMRVSSPPLPLPSRSVRVFELSGICYDHGHFPARFVLPGDRQLPVHIPQDRKNAKRALPHIRAACFA